MQRLEIGKQLIVEEDLALEDAPVTQTRSDETVDVTPLKLFKIVKSVEELKNIDVNKFKQSVIFGAPETAEVNNVFYQWYPDNNLPEEIPFVVASDKSPTGRWVEQVFVSVATFSSNFVTLTTPQYIERGADKQWLNNNIFFGDSSFGQIVLGADEESASLKFSFVDTRGKLFQQEAFIGFDSLGDDDFVVVNNKEGGKIAFGNELSFLGDAKNINNVAVAALPHQAVPKSQLDAAKAALEQAMDSMKQGLEQQIDDLASTVQSNTESIAENSTLIAQNKQDISSNAADIVQNTTRLDELSERMDRITQTGVIIGQITKTMAEVEVDRETILDAFVMERKSREPLEGDSIYTTDSHGYYRHATAWSEPYTISIGIATTVAPGLVKSVDNTDTNRGKVKVDSSSGEMSMVKGEKLPYMDQANTFEQDNVFNKNLRVLQNLNVLGVAYAGGASVGARAPGDNLPQTEDQLLEIHSYNEQGTPSRLKGLATYNKTVDISGMYPCEIVNVDALMRYIRSNVPTDIARKTQVNEFTAVNSFSAGLRVKNNLTILDATGSSDFDKASLTVQGYVRARNSLTADKGLYAGMDHGDSDGGNALFRVTAYPEREDVATGAFYNKVIENPTDDEVVNHRWLKSYVNASGGSEGVKTVATIRTIPYQTLYNGAMVYQEVEMNSLGEILKYRDFFVRGYISSAMFNMGDGSDALKQRVPFSNELEFERLYAGKHHFFAVPKSGQGADNDLHCLGWNGHGQLGDGSTTNRYTPIVKTFPSRVKKVLPTQNGGSYTLTYVLLENGQLYVSGWDNDGYSGLGRTGSTTTWTLSRSNVKDIWSNGIGVLALDMSGTSIYACGRNAEGQLGVGDQNAKTSWTRTTLSSSQLSGFVKVSMSFETQGEYWCTTIALTGGGLYGCGRSIYGELGKLDTNVQSSFLAFPISTQNVYDVASTPLLTVFLKAVNGNTEVWTGGYGTYGKGDGTSASKRLPQSVKTLEGTNWKILTNQKAYTYSDKIDCFFIVNEETETIWAWGANGIGELGIGTNGNTATMTKVNLPAKSKFQFEVDTIYDAHTNVASLLVVIDGIAYACGNGTTRRLWNSTPILTPIN